MHQQLSNSARLRVIEEFQSALAFEWDAATGRLLTVPGLVYLFGLPSNRPVTLNDLLAVVNPKERNEVEVRWADALERGVALDLECRVHPKDQPRRWVRWRAHRFYADGASEAQPAGLRGLVEDITRSRAAERMVERQDAALRESEDRFRILADTMPQMVWSTLPDGFHDYYNARWYEYTGVPEGSTDGEAWNGMFHEEDQPRAWKLWSHSLATGEPYEIEYRLRHRSGEYRWVLGRALPMRDASGNIVRWFGTCTDVDEAKRTAEYLELLSEELSHRIKNIFAILQGLIGLSVRQFPEARDFAADLKSRIAALGRSHDFARPHSRQSMPTVGQTTLHALVREIMRPYPALQLGQVEFRGEDLAIDDKAATPIAMIVHELATNASKYGALSRPEGRVFVTSSVADDLCTVVWEETGGPEVAAPPLETGFGTRLSTVSVEAHLGGRVRRDWRPEGLVFEFDCRLDSLKRPESVSQTTS